MALFPTVTVQIAFATLPLAATPTWVDVSGDVRAITANSCSRSSQQPGLGQFSAGSLTVRLDDKLRKYDPSNAASPYAPNVLPRKEIRVSATINGFTRNLWRGFIEEWPPQRIGINNAEVTITASDALAFLANSELNDELLGEELAWERITEVLDLINWPVAYRNITVNNFDQVLIALEEGYSGSVGQHLQQVADSELGRLFVNRDGVVTFHDRSYIRDQSAGTTFTYGFGDSTAAAELPYTNLQPVFSDADMVNHAIVSLPDWEPGETQDDPSILTTGVPISLSYDTLLAEPVIADHIADVLIWRYKNPRLRFPELDTKGATMPSPVAADALWQALLDIDVGYRVRVRQRHPAGGTMNEQYAFVEGFTHEISKHQWTSTLRLGAPDPTSSWFKVEDATLGRLDSGAGLAY
jgi:hypothetical protein